MGRDTAHEIAADGVDEKEADRIANQLAARTNANRSQEQSGVRTPSN